MTNTLNHLAYNKLEGKSPTIVFLSGFKSDMEGTKAIFLESICREIGQGFIRFDYSGHGKSGGKFEDGNIGQWKDDALQIIDELTEGELVLVGSSMGGWLMLLAALARPQLVNALLGIAAAPDFTEELIWQKFSTAEQEKLMREGKVMIANCYDDQEPYPITKNLIEEARPHLLLSKVIPAEERGSASSLLGSPLRAGMTIDINCPVTLIHGMNDEDVPYQTSIRLAEKLKNQDVKIQLVKNGDHRMSAPENLELLRAELLAILQP